MRLDKLSVYFIVVDWHNAMYRISYRDFAYNEVGADIVSVVTEQTFETMRSTYPYLLHIQDNTRV